MVNTYRSLIYLLWRTMESEIYMVFYWQRSNKISACILLVKDIKNRFSLAIHFKSPCPRTSYMYMHLVEMVENACKRPSINETTLKKMVNSLRPSDSYMRQ